MNPPFGINETITLSKEKLYTCRYGEFVFKLAEIQVPKFGEQLTVREVIKWKDYLTGIESYGVRFREIFNPKFPTWVPALGDNKYINLEPLFNANDFKAIM